MKSPRLLALLLLLIPAGAIARGFEAALPASKWTATDPPVNLAHIDFGEINAHREAVGYHHRPNGIDPVGARLLQIVQPPDEHQVYRGRVAIRDRRSGVWVQKKAPSTFFPDAMSDPDVIEAILLAFHSGQMRDDGQFVGPSGRGFTIEGWFQNGRISAAYPLRGL
ncbi:MAG: EndoU domain-containing protein [Stellaceae bacterium]